MTVTVPKIRNAHTETRWVVPVTQTTVDILMDELEKALERARAGDGADRERLGPVCSLGRDLVDAAWLSESVGVWTLEREQRGRRQLAAAAELTKGSLYETNCADRPGTFDTALSCLRAEDAAWARVLPFVKTVKSKLQPRGPKITATAI